jgi:hypothetical protein
MLVWFKPKKRQKKTLTAPKANKPSHGRVQKKKVVTEHLFTPSGISAESIDVSSWQILIQSTKKVADFNGFIPLKSQQGYLKIPAPCGTSRAVAEPGWLFPERRY